VEIKPASSLVMSWARQWNASTIVWLDR